MEDDIGNRVSSDELDQMLKEEIINAEQNESFNLAKQQLPMRKSMGESLSLNK